MVNSHVENFARGRYLCRVRYTRRNTSWARSSASSGLPTRWCMTDTSRCWNRSTSSANATASSSRTRSISRMSGSRRAIWALVSPVSATGRLARVPRPPATSLNPAGRGGFRPAAPTINLCRVRRRRQRAAAELPTRRVDVRPLALADLHTDAGLAQRGEEGGQPLRRRPAVRQAAHVVERDDVDVSLPAAQQPGELPAV